MHVSQKDMYGDIPIVSRCEGDALEPYFTEGLLLRKLRGFIKNTVFKMKERKERTEG